MSRDTLQKWLAGTTSPPTITLRLLSVLSGTNDPYEAGLLTTNWMKGKPRSAGWWWCVYRGRYTPVPCRVFYNSELSLLVTEFGGDARLLETAESIITRHHAMIPPPPPAR